jgi:hypothetical protein
MKKLIFIISILILASKAKADYLIIDTSRFYISSLSPLEKHPDIKRLKAALKDYGSSCFDDRCNGYEAEWKIINNQLYLSAIHSCDCGNKNLTAKLDTLFPGQLHKGLVKASWFTGDLWLSISQPYYFIDFKGLYKQEKLFSIKQGKVSASKDFKYKDAFVSNYLRSPVPDLKEYVYSHINWTVLPGYTDKKLFLTFKIGANDYPYEIKIIKPLEDSIYNNEAVRVISQIKFGKFYYHGKPFEIYYTIPLLFTEKMRKEAN